MSIHDSTENSILNLYFRAQAISLIADNTATTPLTNIYYALHTADPGDANDQTSNEIAYTSYGRATVARTTAGHTNPSGGSTSPAANVDFAAGTGGSGTATYFSTGSTVSGAGVAFWSGTVSPNIVTGNGVTPRLTTATTITLA